MSISQVSGTWRIRTDDLLKGVRKDGLECIGLACTVKGRGLQIWCVIRLICTDALATPPFLKPPPQIH